MSAQIQSTVHTSFNENKSPPVNFSAILDINPQTSHNLPLLHLHTGVTKLARRDCWHAVLKALRVADPMHQFPNDARQVLALGPKFDKIVPRVFRVALLPRVRHTLCLRPLVRVLASHLEEILTWHGLCNNAWHEHSADLPRMVGSSSSIKKWGFNYSSLQT